MMITDPISDLVTRLKNGSNARKAVVTIPYTKFADNVVHALKKAGYVAAVEKKGKEIVGKTLEVAMVYGTNGARIHDLERVSKPSRRIYQRVTDIRTYKSGFGDIILSTPKGILTGAEARKHKVGGEVLFKIW
jgi:small subunit ribosomal protein S8